MFGATRDALEWSRKTTPRRLRNAAGLWTSYQRAKRSGDPRIGGLPFSISFEPTTACNLRCPECPSGLRSFTRPTGNLKTDLFQRVMDELGPDLWALTFYFKASRTSIRTSSIWCASRASRRLYNQHQHQCALPHGRESRGHGAQRTSRLIISLGGTDQDTYSAYRRGTNWPR